MRIKATVFAVSELSPRSRYGIICTSEISRVGIHFNLVVLVAFVRFHFEFIYRDDSFHDIFRIITLVLCNNVTCGAQLNILIVILEYRSTFAVITEIVELY